MAKTKAATAPPDNTVQSGRISKMIWKNRLFYLLILPGMLYYIVFCYLPMFGVIIAFKDVKPFHSVEEILTLPFVGFKHFKNFFTSYYFGNVLSNTLIIGGMRILFGFPIPIILALLINEVRCKPYKRVTQTISYLPHFISMVVLAGLVVTLTSTETGALNALIKAFGGEPINFMGDPKYFRWTLVFSNIWKEAGWGTIVYLAAITGVNPELHEAAVLDGANKWKRTWHITLPGIAPTISVMLIMSVGTFINAGFEQVLLMYSPSVYSVSDIIDTFVYREGLLSMKYSYSAAVGLFKSLVAGALLLFSNTVAKKLDQPGIW